MSLSNEQIIALQNVKGIGAGTIDKICAEAEHQCLSGLSTGELYDFLARLISSKTVKRLVLPGRNEFDDAVSAARRTMDMSDAEGIHVVSRYEKSFPKMLLDAVDENGRPASPVLLYYRGKLSVTDRPALAVIGTREPTEAGFRAGRYYAEAFAGIGVNIVSGLALGCDTAGHRGALDASGVTTAILANGLDMVYPKENEDLAREIVDNGGLLLSEYAIGTQVSRYNLVARDRLQAGLSNATLVVQCRATGGTMHAVNATLQAGKPLLTVKYRDDQGEMEDGSRILTSKGAVGLRARREEINADPSRFLSMILGDNRSISEPVHEAFTQSLF